MLTKNLVRRFFRNLDAATKPSFDPIPKKVILTSTALDLTGAQRQLTNTAIEIKKILNAPMKIFFMGVPNPKAGLLVKALEKNGIEMAVFRNFNGIVPLNFASLMEPLQHLMKQDQALILTLYDRFMKERPEVVHAWGMATGATTAVAALMAGVPKIILGWRGMSPFKKEFPVPKDSFCHHKSVFQHLMQYPQIRFIANSLTALQDYAEWLECDIKRFHLIRNGLNTDFLESFPEHDLKASLKIPSDKIIIGGMHRFHEDKHPELWVETARVLLQKRKDLVFVLAGAGTLLPKAQKMVLDYNLQGHFIFLGQYVNVKSFYESLDCFLLTSRREGEGLPNVLLESQYFGVPTVTTGGGGAIEALMEGTGVLCKQDDPHEIARSVEHMISKRQSREALRKLYKPFVETNFSLQNLGRKFIDLYEI